MGARHFSGLCRCVFATALASCIVTIRPMGSEGCLRCEEGFKGALSYEEQTPSLAESAASSEMLVTGARIFEERCAVCHGDRGYGDGALAEVLPIKPRNYHQDAFVWGTRPSDIVSTISLGRSGVMPSFYGTLSEQEMWAVAHLVWGWIPERARHADTAEDLRQWCLPVPSSGG